MDNGKSPFFLDIEGSSVGFNRGNKLPCVGLSLVDKSFGELINTKPHLFARHPVPPLAFGVSSEFSGCCRDHVASEAKTIS